MLLFDDVDTFGLRLWRKFVTHPLGNGPILGKLPISSPPDPYNRRDTPLAVHIDPHRDPHPTLKKTIGLNIAY